MKANKSYYDVVVTLFHDARHWKRDLGIAQRHMENGYSALVVTNFPEGERICNQQGIDFINVSGGGEAISFSDVESEYSRLQDKFDIRESVYQLVEVEYVQNRPMYRSKVECIRQLIEIMIAYERWFTDIKVDVAFQLYASEIHRKCFELFFKTNSTHYVMFTQSMVPGKELMFIDDDNFNSVRLNKEFGRGEQSVNIDQWRDKTSELKKAGKFLYKREANLLKDIKYLPKILDRLKNVYMSKYLIRWLKRMCWWPFRRVVWRMFYEEPKDEKYVFYPLHAPGEAQVIIRGYPYVDEFALLKQIALSLPLGYKLYVKEHPGWEGRYDLCGLSKIKDIEEICLIRSTVNSHDLIENASLIVLINSSVWFEGLLFNKPVIALGKGLFSGYGLLNEVTDLRELAAEINKNLHLDVSNQDVFERYLHAILSVSYDVPYHFDDDCLECIDRLYDGFVDHVGWLKTNMVTSETG